MAHGASIGVGEDDEYFGAVGPFLVDAGISSTYQIATFFGLTENIHHARETTEAPEILPPTPSEADPESSNRAGNLHGPGFRARVDIGGVITRALAAAGLLK
jgi:feruloyl esterase